MKLKNLRLNIKFSKEFEKGIQNNIDIETNIKSECSEIFSNLFVSGYKYSCDYDFLLKNNFTNILNCAGGSKNFKQQKYDDFLYLTLDIKDDPEYEIKSSILVSIEYIEKCLNSNGKLLIHCFEGISRGPTLLAGYIMWKFNLNRDEAIKLIKEKRPNIEINLGFLVQLDKWDHFLRNQ